MINKITDKIDQFVPVIILLLMASFLVSSIKNDVEGMVSSGFLILFIRTGKLK